MISISNRDPPTPPSTAKIPLHRNPAQRQVFRKLCIRNIQRRQIRAQPRSQNIHYEAALSLTSDFAQRNRARHISLLSQSQRPALSPSPVHLPVGIHVARSPPQRQNPPHNASKSDAAQVTHPHPPTPSSRDSLSPATIQSQTPAPPSTQSIRAVRSPAVARRVHAQHAQHRKQHHVIRNVQTPRRMQQTSAIALRAIALQRPTASAIARYLSTAPPHANCSRNRISPEYSSPISLIPYFIIAIRSTPIPNANPLIFAVSYTGSRPISTRR